MVDEGSTNYVQGETEVWRLGSGGTEVVVIEDVMRDVRAEKTMHMDLARGSHVVAGLEIRVNVRDGL